MPLILVDLFKGTKMYLDDLQCNVAPATTGDPVVVPIIICIIVFLKNS